MSADDANKSNLQDINQEIYKRNLELAVVNKTLSLLRKLYQISLLSLDPAMLSEKVSLTILEDLHMESVGIFLFDKEKDTLKPFKFATSERVQKMLASINKTVEGHTLENISKVPILDSVINHNKPESTFDVTQIWGEIDPAMLATIKKQSHTATILLYPLSAQENVIGMLFLGLSRDYEKLSEHEKDSINSLINVVAVALDKAMLYEKLRVANEQLKALDKARAEFISIASHQLRTPPATIKWYLNAIIAGDFGKLDEELLAALKRTNVTNDAQIATIDDLLNASRIERGKLEFFFEKDPVEPVVSLLVEQMQPLAQMKKMSIEYIKPSGEFPEILMDKEKVRQVVNNMIDNAIKYSKSGPIKVSLTKDDNNITIKVKDNGKGIAPKELQTIFQKYIRGHDSVTHATGLGLGMYVAKVIVEQHNGKIWAESEGVGNGSTFAFSLPIESNLTPTAVDLAAPAA